MVSCNYASICKEIKHYKDKENMFHRITDAYIHKIDRLCYSMFGLPQIPFALASARNDMEGRAYGLIGGRFQKRLEIIKLAP